MISLAQTSSTARRISARTSRARDHAAGREVRIAADATVAAALRRMSDSDSSRLLVEDQGRIIGLITHTGITRFVRMKTELEDEARLRQS